MSKSVLVRKDIRDLTQAETDELIKAFRHIQSLPPDDENSYFQIASYHGEPFRGAGYGNGQWWGGYCNHGNILFPTWHRAYLSRLEKALQKKFPSVTIPYWNEIDGKDIPDIFLTPTYRCADDESACHNPLWSYAFQRTITDRLQTIPDADYSKPKGMQTCRFPFSGLYGDADRSTTEAHNNIMKDLGIEKTNRYLNDNVKEWLNLSSYKTSMGKVVPAGVIDRYKKCLKAPYYTIFSNTTSAERWNDDHSDDSDAVHFPAVPLESPHNAIHLAVGGIQIPIYDRSSVPGANGDMGENDTASFDPIFYFHHAFIDMLFWKWQNLHSQTKNLEIEPMFVNYPGTNSVDMQGPTPGVAGGTWLTLDTPLDPFKHDSVPFKHDTVPMTSKDVVDITKLGYKYQMPNNLESEDPAPSPCLSIGGINRTAINGSFAISAWAFTSNTTPPQLIGIEPVLSRWHVSGCANCQSHLEVRAHLPLEGWKKKDAEKTAFQVLVHTRASPGGLAAPGGRKPNFKLHHSMIGTTIPVHPQSEH